MARRAKMTICIGHSRDVRKKRFGKIIGPYGFNGKILGGKAVWDIAAGASHSLVLADAVAFKSDVYFCGKAGKSTGLRTENKPRQICPLTSMAEMRKVGRVRCLAAGGQFCACVAVRDVGAFATTLQEFAITERFFHKRLVRIYSIFLEPILDRVEILEKTIYWHPIELMIKAFQDIIDTVALTHVELSHVIGRDGAASRVAALGSPDAGLGAFCRYAQCLCDAIALGAVEQCVKAVGTFFEDVKDSFVKVTDIWNVDLDNIALTFTKILRIPFSRAGEYHMLLAKLSFSSSKMSERLTVASRCWENFRQSTVTQQELAQTTKEFWESSSARTLDSLRAVGRRLLRDSCSHPISLHLASLFSSHSFLLFSDIFVHNQWSAYQIYPLVTVWAEAIPSSDTYKNTIKLTTPEDTVILSAPSSSTKTEWLRCITHAIRGALDDQKDGPGGRPAAAWGGCLAAAAGRGGRQRGERLLTPPRHRHAVHVFTRHALYQDATYEGVWRDGQLHGSGVMRWSDGRKYVGRFKDGEQDGFGIYTATKVEGSERYEGLWKAGKMHGLGQMMYANGDVYEGSFREGRRHGHGMMKQGKVSGGVASIYVGEWAHDRKSGFGVLDNVLTGQKFLGSWVDDSYHGNGVIVTLDGMYFEGQFIQNKMAGFGVLLTEDNTSYEGEFSGGPNLYGKGRLTLPNGDYIDGHFNGSFSEGIKVNGMFHKAAEPVGGNEYFSHSAVPLPKSYGTLAVPADEKWKAIFLWCYSVLGCGPDIVDVADVVDEGRRRATAWERVAGLLALGRKAPHAHTRQSGCVADDLALIPTQGDGDFSLECWAKIREYIGKAFDSPVHPLGRLMSSLVDVYRVTYVGVGAHPRLLRHAVDDVVSYVRRIYPILRVLFPVLPPGDADDGMEVYSEAYLAGQTVGHEDTTASMACEIFTVAGLLHPLLLPRIYPPLFHLYALYNEKDDDAYWKKVLQWNKQADLALMAYLGVQQQFWLMDEAVVISTKRMSVIKDQSYVEATDTLQRLSTSFSPAEKLQQIQQTFHEINKLVQQRVSEGHLWCMDDLFPVFLYVVVRARIQHLGAEIHFIDDLMQNHLQFGELGLMFTTLKACFFQIQHEKII